MKVFNYRYVKSKDAEGGSEGTKVRWLITKDTGANNFAMRLFEIKPEGHTPLHEHPWEHEVFVLEGKGIIMSQNGEVKFKKGDVIFISPNEKHQFVNKSKKETKFLCIIPYI
ncbi:hypothetical protein AC481_03500 [miscellaneous Crenarchaeota group archaeon SMTZ-80]|nr:MAG: hypothetical protein AC481_03500 [miscellaneous Crenarchaeota group archaeon SMTZ-80]